MITGTNIPLRALAVLAVTLLLLAPAVTLGADAPASDDVAGSSSKLIQEMQGGALRSDELELIWCFLKTGNMCKRTTDFTWPGHDSVGMEFRTSPEKEGWLKKLAASYDAQLPKYVSKNDPALRPGDLLVASSSGPGLVIYVKAYDADADEATALLLDETEDLKLAHALEHFSLSIDPKDAELRHARPGFLLLRPHDAKAIALLADRPKITGTLPELGDWRSSTPSIDFKSQEAAYHDACVQSIKIGHGTIAVAQKGQVTKEGSRPEPYEWSMEFPIDEITTISQIVEDPHQWSFQINGGAQKSSKNLFAPGRWKKIHKRNNGNLETSQEEYIRVNFGSKEDAVNAREYFEKLVP